MTGSGTVGDPYIIENVTDLQNVENDLAAYYELGSDIDASATSTWNGGLGFLPIGYAADFTGQLDGKGYAIDRLFINRNDGRVGLFDINAGTIQNVGLTNCDITGFSVGSIACENSGTITKCYSTGAVKAGTMGGESLGGVVSWNYGTITNSYTRCSVTGQGSGSAGGFIWYNTGTCDDDYSTGAVSGADSMGGFCVINGDTITNCFWDTQTSGQAASDGGTGKTTALMKTLATFTDVGWDFATIWNIFASINDGYPFLQIRTPTIGRRHWWVEEDEFHFFGYDGIEYKVKGSPVTGADAVPWWFGF